MSSISNHNALNRSTTPSPMSPPTRSNSSLPDPSSSQSLASILNNPNASDSTSSWSAWWSSSASVAAPPDFLPLLPKSGSDSLTRSDFLPYLSSISDHYHRFEDILNHVKNEHLHLAAADDDDANHGEALVACLREVPALYFKEDFALEDGATFKSACPFSGAGENLVLQEKLSHYLDVVELHLIKEISLRSSSFYEAQGQLEDLNVKIVEGCNRIRELRATISLLDVDLVDSARKIQELNVTRTSLLALQQKLRLILYVNQALSALQLLVASADCAGALDVTDDLQHLLDGDELPGLHCFHHLRDRVAASIDSINSILSSDFMRASIHDAGDTDTIIISKAKGRGSILMNGEDSEDKLDDEETSNYQDRLLPIIIGLLRTVL